LNNLPLAASDFADLLGGREVMIVLKVFESREMSDFWLSENGDFTTRERTCREMMYIW
jgi:hypothetical protein